MVADGFIAGFGAGAIFGDGVAFTVTVAAVCAIGAATVVDACNAVAVTVATDLLSISVLRFSVAVAAASAILFVAFAAVIIVLSVADIVTADDGGVFGGVSVEPANVVGVGLNVGTIVAVTDSATVFIAALFAALIFHSIITYSGLESWKRTSSITCTRMMLIAIKMFLIKFSGFASTSGLAALWSSFYACKITCRCRIF